MSPAERLRLASPDGLRRDLGRQSVRAALVTGAASFADFALRLGSTAILARLVLPEHFGLVMMASAVVAVADQLRELGLSSSTVQRPEITHAEVSNLFWINAGFAFVLSLLLVAAAPFVAHYFHDDRLAPVTAALAFTLLAGGLSVQHQALLTRQLKLGHTAAIRLASSLLGTALAVALAWWDFGYWALVWREIARAAFLMLGVWACFPWRPSLPSRRTDIRAQLAFGANLTAANLLSSVSAGLDRFLLGRFASASAVGIYRQAFQLVAAPTDQLLSPLYQVAQPSLSLLQNDPARFRRLYLKLLTLVCVLTMPLSLFVALYATEITLALLGPVWLEAAPVLCVLSFGTFVKQAVGSTAFILIARGHGGTYLRLTLLHNVTLLLALVVGVRWGILGAAAAEVFTTLALIAPRLRFSLAGSPVNLRSYLATLARPLAASVAMALALAALHPHLAHAAVPAQLAAGALAAAAVFGAAWLLLPGGKTETLALVGDLRAAVRRRTRLVDSPAAPATS